MTYFYEIFLSTSLYVVKLVNKSYPMDSATVDNTADLVFLPIPSAAALPALIRGCGVLRSDRRTEERGERGSKIVFFVAGSPCSSLPARIFLSPNFEQEGNGLIMHPIISK